MVHLELHEGLYKSLDHDLGLVAEPKRNELQHTQGYFLGVEAADSPFIFWKADDNVVLVGVSGVILAFFHHLNVLCMVLADAPANNFELVGIVFGLE